MTGAAHAPGHHHLHVPGNSIVHRLDPAAKIVGLLLFVAAVAVTPRRAVPVFALDAAILAAAVALSGCSPRLVTRRLTVVAPFLVFAATVPFVAGGSKTEVLGVTMSEPGLWAAWNITAKTVLGATAAILIAATTSVPDLMRGLTRLRLPSAVTSIVAFMFRYLDLLVDQLRRMRIAMTARGHDPRWLWQARPMAASAGSLFVRSYERGERVHAAMLSRGYTGAMLELVPAGSNAAGATGRGWVVAAAPGAVAVAALVTNAIIG
jgi:cobalt/nickel transport system permease protein